MKLEILFAFVAVAIKGKPGWLKLKVIHANRPIHYEVFIPKDAGVYHFNVDKELEKIDELPGDPPPIERGSFQWGTRECRRRITSISKNLADAMELVRRVVFMIPLSKVLASRQQFKIREQLTFVNRTSPFRDPRLDEYREAPFGVQVSRFRSVT